MTYEKQEWKTGDVITEGKLNHIENGLKDTSEGIGFKVENKEVVIFSGEIATSRTVNGAYGSGIFYDKDLDTEKIDVVFDGVEYKDIPFNNFYGSYYWYGAKFNGYYDADSFKDYPFSILVKFDKNGTILVTQAAGTHTIEVRHHTDVAETTEDFDLAINQNVEPMIESSAKETYDKIQNQTIVIEISEDNTSGSTSYKFVDCHSQDGKYASSNSIHNYLKKDIFPNVILKLSDSTNAVKRFTSQHIEIDENTSTSFPIITIVFNGGFTLTVQYGGNQWRIAKNS